MDKKYCIYKHTNIINNKVYIGLTSLSLVKRCGSNGNNYSHSTYFYSAILKYGWNNFSHEILEENLTKQEAEEREKYYIQLYKSNNKEFGYNLTSGGELGKTYSSFVREKMSLKKKGVPLSEEHRKHISEATKGKNNSNYGKHCSEETKEKIRKTKYKPIQCVETGKIYPNKLEASKDVGLKSPRSIMSALKEPWRTAGKDKKTRCKCHWKYVEVRE